jgi:GntR family transcriptional regulator
MLIRVEPSSGVPITRQIVDQIRSRCASGLLKAGDRLPSVRELARQIAVNQNTILRAYERLTAEGVLELRHGEGTFVADFAAARQLKREKASLEEEVQRWVRKGMMLGVSGDEMHGMLSEALDEVDKGSRV